MIGLIGKKIGMTRIFDEEGNSLPVSIIKIEDNNIVQIKKIKKEGYNSIQISCFIKNKKIKKTEIGHFQKSKTGISHILQEFKSNENDNFKLGQKINIEIFSKIKKVDITGYSKGKGFSGTVKRWNFKTQDASHGNSLSHRKPGSIGQNQSPGKVFKGKKMAGQLGNKKTTVKNLDITKLDYKRNVIVVKGSIPGSKNSKIIIRPSNYSNRK